MLLVWIWTKNAQEKKQLKSILICPGFVLQLFLMNKRLWYIHNKAFKMKNFLKIKSSMDLDKCSQTFQFHFVLRCLILISKRSNRAIIKNFSGLISECSSFQNRLSSISNSNWVNCNWEILTHSVQMQIFCKTVQTLSAVEHDIGCSISYLFLLLYCFFFWSKEFFLTHE